MQPLFGQPCLLRVVLTHLQFGQPAMSCTHVGQCCVCICVARLSTRRLWIGSQLSSGVLGPVPRASPEQMCCCRPHPCDLCQALKSRRAVVSIQSTTHTLDRSTLRRVELAQLSFPCPLLPMPSPSHALPLLRPPSSMPSLSLALPLDHAQLDFPHAPQAMGTYNIQLGDMEYQYTPGRHPAQRPTYHERPLPRGTTRTAQRCGMGARQRWCRWDMGCMGCAGARCKGSEGCKGASNASNASNARALQSCLI